MSNTQREELFIMWYFAIHSVWDESDRYWYDGLYREETQVIVELLERLKLRHLTVQDVITAVRLCKPMAGQTTDKASLEFAIAAWEALLPLAKEYRDNFNTIRCFP